MKAVKAVNSSPQSTIVSCVSGCVGSSPAVHGSWVRKHRSAGRTVRVVAIGATAAILSALIVPSGLAATSATTMPSAGATSPGSQPGQTAEQRADALLTRMTSDDKFELVGSDIHGIPRLGIPPLTFRDGPHGVGENSRGVTAFPNAVNVGASWDPVLAERYGAALGREARAAGATLLAAPTSNILRTPLWGRAAETYSEDPYLTSALVAPEVQGIQRQGVIAEPKHFAGNNQEYGRFGVPLGGPGVDDRVSMRTLQEVYFPGFKSAVRQGGAGSVMCSYNQINGTQSCQDPTTLGLLKSWGLKGFVEPDALLAIRDVPVAANAGVDNFQLGSVVSAVSGSSGGTAERDALKAAVAVGKVPMSRINDAARRILIGMAQAGVLAAQNPTAPTPTAQPSPSTADSLILATDLSTQGTVLLQNKTAGPAGTPVLPLSESDKKIAVIGYDAGPGTQIQEGGSPSVLASRPAVTPLDGIRARAPQGTQVGYAQGTLGVVPLPVVPTSVLTPASGSGQGLSGTFYTGKTPAITGNQVLTRVDPTIDFQTASTPLHAIPNTEGANSARWEGTLTPPNTGTYRFSLTFAGNAELFVNNQQVASGDTNFVNGAPAFSGAHDVAFHGTVDLTAGHKVPVKVEYATNASIAGAELHLGWQPPDPRLRDQAVQAARDADVAVVFVNDVTTEGADRTSLSLPGDQDALIEAVTSANPRTVVVLHTASAVLMPWRDKVAAIVEAWYPGQTSGTAIAKTLYGDVDPSGRLPVTFPADASQGPTSDPQRYPGTNNVVQYSERLNVGYRYYDVNNQKPLFPFGYGLSYTSFALSNLRIGCGTGGSSATVDVRNAGQRGGTQTIQLYTGFPSKAGEPPRQLKSFTKVALQPGQTKTVALALPASGFQLFDEARSAWTTPGGTYHLAVGTSSAELPLTTDVSVPAGDTTATPGCAIAKSTSSKGSNVALPVALGVLAAVLIVGGAVLLLRRRRASARA